MEVGESTPTLTPLEYDYWLLGLTPDASAKDVKQAYWNSRLVLQAEGASDLVAKLETIERAYRRLRRMYRARHPVPVISPERAQQRTTLAGMAR